ncbi:MAG: proprotein convertase P-domain-containing protein [Deltaproteobacteria bacterium]|nr:proprotein convertase P-domain-containing protein [Deltaproteobacteria bacterium]
MKKTHTTLFILSFAIFVCGAAAANPNTKYGEVYFNKLPLKGFVSKNIWVGSWWAYSLDGISYRHKDTSISIWSWKGKFDRFDKKDASLLSPAEKFDKVMKREDKIEYSKVKDYLKSVYEGDSIVSDLMEEQRKLVYKINKLIAENENNPDFDWKITAEGKKYLENQKKIEAEEQKIKDKKFTVDTATEYEILSHGNGQFGVGDWYGHCNAWSAAAIMDPEPRKSVEVGGITFSPGDIKALLTEAWMEHHSSFFGSRNDNHDDPEAREAVDFKDVTPAAFHIFFADQIGNKDKSFVIDRFTGAEVWNQPLKAYRSSYKSLYKVVDGKAVPEKTDVKITKYDYYGEGSVSSLGKMDVYPVLVTATFHWVTDGLPHEDLTVLNITDDIDDKTFADSYKIKNLYDDQIHLRTLAYVLWLDKPADDANAQIVGDGEWKHGAAADYNHTNPDFMWQPLAQVNGYRDYENEFVDYDYIAKNILPKSLEQQDNPVTPPGAYKAAGLPMTVPDNKPDAPAVVKINVPDDFKIYKMQMDVKIEHTYIGDLKYVLTSPSGKYTTLKKYGTGGSQADISKTHDVKKFNNTNAKGEWTLKVYDNADQDEGKVKEVTLRFTKL